VALDATVGGANANSYVTLAVAQQYFDDRLYTDAWDTATEETQQSALIMACRWIEQETFVGSPATSTQALAWPRYSVEKKNGGYYLSTEIPALLQQAQCDLALALLSDSSLTETGDMSGFDSMQLGSLAVTLRTNAAGIMPVSIKTLLADVLAAGAHGIRVFRG